MAPSARRRVSYVIPPPAEPPVCLQLPPHGVSRHGAARPLLVPSQSSPDPVLPTTSKKVQHPRHRLGIACLALDASTQLVGRASPEGILYTGGRDGLVTSWDLGMPMKKRTRKYGASRVGQRRPSTRWEIMTGWADDAIEEEDEEEGSRRDGDILGEVKESGARRRRRSNDNEIPLEDQWELDSGPSEPGKPTQFRQSAQAHTDWVNDIALCNYNQTVLSGSSDGTVKAWTPHSTDSVEPSVIGTHGDYVRCLAPCREQTWVASGSFDRTIRLWDLTRGPSSSKPEPIITLQPPDSSVHKASVYALATDPFGHTIVSGSPERVVRMWDPRSGKRVAKLVGHTDNIRAILISEDSRYLLTGSADASIKLWSLSSQRCLHTFTHHTDSVWSLFSSHPSLEIFYSGDRSGLVCRVDVEDCSDVSEGECIVLCQETGERNMVSAEGINKIAVMDDTLLWTASGTSDLRRWRIPPRRALRTGVLGSPEVESPGGGVNTIRSPSQKRDSLDVARSVSPPRSPRPRSSLDLPQNALKGQHRASMAPSIVSVTSGHDGRDDYQGSETLFGIPFESLVRLSSSNASYTPFSPMATRGRDPDVATLYSAASVMSVPRQITPMQAAFSSPQTNRFPTSETTTRSETVNSHGGEDFAQPVNNARIDYEEREVATDAVPLVTVPDDVVEGDSGLVRSIILNDRIHALTVDTCGEVAVWDIVRGVCLGRYTPETVSAASYKGSTAEGSSGCERERSPREALESVRERIEGEAVVMSWAAVDTKIGVLTVHLNEKCFEAEIYADEAGYGQERPFTDETRLNIGKWVLRNLFLGFIREEQRIAARKIRDSHGYHHGFHRDSAPGHIDVSGQTSAFRRRSLSEASLTTSGAARSSIVLNSPDMLPAISPQLPSARSSPLMTPMIQLHPIAKEGGLTPIPGSPTILGSSSDATPMPRPQSGGAPVATAPPTSSREADYFSLSARRGSQSGVRPSSPDENAQWAGASSTKSHESSSVPPTPSTPGSGGFMGKLRHFGKNSKRASDTVVTPGTATANQDSTSTPATDPSSSAPSQPKSPLQTLLSNPLTPPTSSDAPPLSLPSNMSLIISEEGAPGWEILYRGSTSSAGADIHSLEEAMPMWLLEYLLINKVPPTPVIKVSFVLLPYPTADPSERLPELLNTAQSKLTASRFLRVRKLTYHVQDKLERLAGAAMTPRSSFDSGRLTRDASSRPRAEENYEILCNEIVLPLDMTLAAVRQYIWRQTSELVMHYRRKAPSPSSPHSHAFLHTHPHHRHDGHKHVPPISPRVT